jgi:rhodanese-related sulfurtransferase
MARERLDRKRAICGSVKADFPMSSNLIISCETGPERAIQPAERLKCAGFRNVLKMSGGFRAWAEQKLPIAE